MGPVVFCPNGHVFESRALRIEGARRVVLKGNRETCPHCGALAEIMDGEFDFLEGSIRVLSAPQVTQDRLRSLITSVRDLPAQEAVQAIEQEAPGLRRLLPKDTKQWAPWLAVLLSLLQLLATLRPPNQAPAEPSQQQIEQIIRNIMKSGPNQPRENPRPPLSK